MDRAPKISVLVERMGEWWVAQCVEHDLATQARTLDDLQIEIERLLFAHVHSCEELGIEPFQIPPAPADVGARFERARTRVEPLGTLGPKLVVRREPPRPEIRIAA